MKSNKINRNTLKAWNVTLQLFGIMFLCFTLWFSPFSVLGGLASIALTVVVFFFFKVIKSVTEIDVSTNGELVLTRFSQKQEAVSKVFFRELLGDVFLYDSKGKNLVVLNKLYWTNFEGISTVIKEKFEPYIESKDSLKKFIKEVIKEEVKDPL